ncbi:Cytochrome b561 [Oligella sp. MSHR50489EDL]|uniref:cytochrome b n=1 Tax=Oligella sp. MSHR50489EDL TaxID=3139409 RepID=UPI003D813D9A
MSTSVRYTSTAIFLHWLMALGLIGTLSLGLYMQGLPFSPSKLQFYSWHKWAGITLLLLAIVRLAWRLSHPAPALPAEMGALSKLGAHAIHWLLYLLMLAIPISGWLMSSAQGFSVMWFGIVPLPDLVAPDPDLGNLLTKVHITLNYLLMASIVAHVGAALFHHFIKKDTVLKRMMPRMS